MVALESTALSAGTLGGECRVSAGMDLLSYLPRRSAPKMGSSDRAQEDAHRSFSLQHHGDLGLEFRWERMILDVPRSL